jgi:hypothetical protein
VQQRLGTAARRGSEPATKAPASPLTGKVFDEHGEPLYAQGAAKGVRRYRYFVSRGLVRGVAAKSKSSWRVAAPQLERAVLSAARSILADQASLVAALGDSSDDAENLEQILAIASDWRQRLSAEHETLPALADLIKQVQLTASGLRVTVNLPIVMIATHFQEGIALSHFVPMRMKRRGVELRLILGARAEERLIEVDSVLLRALARARVWFDEVASGRASSLAEIAPREGLKKRYVARLAKLAFIAPSIAEAIVAGRAPVGVNLQMLMERRVELDPRWSEQQRAFNGIDLYHQTPVPHGRLINSVRAGQPIMTMGVQHRSCQAR